MTEEQAKSLMVAGCQMIYEGITYSHVESVRIRYNRKEHRYEIDLVLKDLRANSVTAAPADRCIPVPL